MISCQICIKVQPRRVKDRALGYENILWCFQWFSAHIINGIDRLLKIQSFIFIVSTSTRCRQRFINFWATAPVTTSPETLLRQMLREPVTVLQETTWFLNVTYILIQKDYRDIRLEEIRIWLTSQGQLFLKCIYFCFQQSPQILIWIGTSENLLNTVLCFWMVFRDMCEILGWVDELERILKEIHC